MSADIMLVCPQKGEIYDGRHPERAFLLGDTCDERNGDEFLIAMRNLFYRDVSAEDVVSFYGGRFGIRRWLFRWITKDAMVGSFSRWTGNTGEELIVDIETYQMNDALFTDVILEAHRAYRSDSVEERRKLAKWLAIEHVDMCIGLEFW